MSTVPIPASIHREPELLGQTVVVISVAPASYSKRHVVVVGKAKNPCRLAYGVASLPLGAPVELEVIFELAG